MLTRKQVANRLTDVDIRFVSLVAAGANKREFLAKADNEDGTAALNFTMSIRKLDDEEQIVTGVLYMAGEVDTQGDFMQQVDLDSAMHRFMEKGRTAAGVACDVDHDEQPTADYIAECYKIEEGDSRWPAEEVGNWVVSRKIVDDGRWQAVKAGTYNAFSFGGFAKRVPDVEVTKAAQKEELRELVLRTLDKGKVADILSRMRVPQLIEATAAAMWEAYHGAPAEEGAELEALRDIIAEANELFKAERKGLRARVLDAIFGTEEEPATQEPQAAAEKDGEEQPPVITEEQVEERVQQAVEEAVKAAREPLNREIAELTEQVARLEKHTNGTQRAEITERRVETVEEGFHFA